MRVLAMFWKLTRYARVARLLLVFFMGFLLAPRVHAQTNPYANCLDKTKYAYVYACETREEAYTGAKAASLYAASALGYQPPYVFLRYDVTGNQVRAVHRAATGHEIYGVRTWAIECKSGTSWDPNTNMCSCPSGQIKNSLTGQCMQACSSRSEFTTSSTASTGQYIPNGSIGCRDGCMYVHYNSAGGVAIGTFLGDETYNQCFVTPTCDTPGYYLSPGTGMCQPPKPECKANQTKDPKTGECADSCPVGMVLSENGECEKAKNTCPAGQVQAPDGSCVQDSCPAGQTKGADGTCKKSTDSNKDEGDDDKYFGGGDDCSAPPSCSGDPILCGQARIQWRIDCNTRKNTNVSGGSCAAMPVCTGEKCDALEYAQLLQQWRATCALEKLADKGGASGEGDQGMQGDPDFDADADGKAAADRLGDGGVHASDAFSDGSANNGGQGGNPGGDGELDKDGLGLPRSCPNLPSVTVFGTTLDFNQAGGVMCNWISIGGYFVLVLAAFASVRILASGSSV